MENKSLFFEIKELEVSDGFSANMVMVENNGEGPAYLGWCENLAINTAACLDCLTAPGVLVLPFADMGILSHQGVPIPAPADWKELAVRSLVFQDYLLVMIETELELNLAATS